ncbi:anthranilate phosphoribosyltransferase [Pseudactinotalea suaedae]|uniref:anthranilate phosphoribosyltransferase n=1 Tax=Pseudactinotalea suaedae TaxID=1524924 RepID=UPI0012E21D2E|nr:anthranilate phosphoribosyltransferase [Pseudactinotalea suaedae]
MTAAWAQSDRSWPDLLSRLLTRHDLTHDETAWAMNQVMSGATSPTILAGFLLALGTKGETVAELRGLADAMLAHAVPIEIPGDAVDVVGTGGDRHRSVNISTTASIVVAGAGLRVVKHGNRAASSASGAADVLEALGVRLDLPPARAAELAQEVGITFLFAASYHPAMRHAGPVRAELKVPTAFNVLGPLTNPAQPRAGAVGVGNPRMAPLVAGVFAERGRSVLVFRNDDGLDELAPTSTGRIWEVTAATGGEVVEHHLDFVEDLGMSPATLDDLRGGDAVVNARALRDVLDGTTGPVRDTVLLNAAAAIVADGSAPGLGSGTLTERLQAGLRIAAAAVDSGAAAETLQRWVAASTA